MPFYLRYPPPLLEPPPLLRLLPELELDEPPPNPLEEELPEGLDGRLTDEPDELLLEEFLR